MSRHVVVVGGGIAGLSAAWHLARRGVARVTLFEREPLLCAQASGRNAAIFRPLEADVVIAELAQRSLVLFEELGADTPLVDRRGLVLLARSPERLAPTAEAARSLGIEQQWVEPDEMGRLLPGLRVLAGWCGLYAGGAGVIDIHTLAERLARACRELGVQIRLGGGVERLRETASRVAAVEMHDGELIACDDVVLAGGAWNGALGLAAGLPLPLIPIRRHLVLLRPRQPLRDRFPAVWSLDDEVYFRQEGGSLLASPCDETEWLSGAPQAQIDCLEPLAAKLGAIDLALGGASVVRYWACLRTFAPDRRPVIGADPRMSGVHWLAGLGGFGMTAGVAAGERLAQQLLGHCEGNGTLGPERLLTAQGK